MELCQTVWNACLEINGN